MKSRLVLLACCLALLSSCGQGDKGTGKAPEFAVIEAKTTTANLTNSYPATIKGKQDVEIRPMVSGSSQNCTWMKAPQCAKDKCCSASTPYSIRQP
mgnify:FL=1